MSPKLLAEKNLMAAQDLKSLSHDTSGHCPKIACIGPGQAGQRSTLFRHDIFDAIDVLEERAGILEHDAGMSRAAAELQALAMFKADTKLPTDTVADIVLVLAAHGWAV